MDDLVAWLREQFDTDASCAETAAEELGLDWYYDNGHVLARRERDMVVTGSQDFLERERGEYIAAHDPARVLREIDARRGTLAQCKAAEERMDQAMRDDDTAAYQAARSEAKALHAVIRRDAAVYAARPGYRQEWRP